MIYFKGVKVNNHIENLSHREFTDYINKKYSYMIDNEYNHNCYNQETEKFNHIQPSRGFKLYDNE